MNALTQQGISALKAGNRKAARQFLGAALRQDPGDLQAWLWLSGAVEQDEAREDCLRQVLRLDPNNQTAARGLAKILEKDPVPSTTGTENDAQSEPPLQAPVVRIISPIYPARSNPSYANPRAVFRARPSFVPVILFFWLMVFCLYGLMRTWQQDIGLIFPVVAALALTGGFFVLIVLIYLVSTRYELTTGHVSLPHKGKKIKAPIDQIFSVEIRQTRFQKLLGSGDIMLDAGLHGVLRSLTIRNVPNVKLRADQILHEVR